MWCWARKEKVTCSDRVIKEEILQRVKEETDILHTIKRLKGNWISHVLPRSFLLKYEIV
jgi:hypothetical protein